MAERKRIALNYQAGYDFSAGIVIYIQNLIKGFKLLPENQKPQVVLICSDQSPMEEIRKIDYPYLDVYHYKPIPNSFIVRVINKISRELFHRNFVKRYSFPTNVSVLYPFFDSLETYSIQKRYYWKPDFQEMYYPQYISEKELDYAITYMKNVSAHREYTLVLSSEDSFNDYRKFFSPFVNPVHVLPFISIVPEIQSLDQKKILNQYEIQGPYFMVANQFWPHKNHLLVLEAIRILKQEIIKFCVVFSGKQSSYRDQHYFSKLKEFTTENDLGDFVKFIGFVPREEQLVLMKNSIAVIQPSLFEGWSTVIEDCKALNHFVLAADLEVNKEQVSKNCSFFNPKSAADLASLMKKLISRLPDLSPNDYSQSVEKFKKQLVTIFNPGPGLS